MAPPEDRPPEPPTERGANRRLSPRPPGRAGLPGAMARIARLVPGTAARAEADRAAAAEEAAREVFRSAVIAGSSEPLVPAVRTPRPSRKAATAPAAATSFDSPTRHVAPAPPPTASPAASPAAPPTATRAETALLARRKEPPKAPVPASAAGSRSPAAIALAESERAAEAPPPTTHSRKRQPGDTAPSDLLRVPDTADRVADSFFGGLIRRVDGDR